ncbi:hypothetical protein DSL72_003514 [Monilinia vaccinii-corymbosi]|uniref:3CxxC-type domain-containing protein n=1 Tax=Monilinia vaccinii-corymbosi TaxID=61207 RepID=A0A8A3NTI1_9HELO|nr:hypothetical protein DSL72_003514 [Monilinia vaccinii-corymbosi]
MPSRRKGSSERWSMYPLLHDSVSRLLKEENLHFDFHDVDDDASCIKEYDTRVMGRFICHNDACNSHGWSSKRIAITIRMYPEEKYNGRVYHQRCRSCNSLSKPLLDDSYAERVAYRIKKWRGIQMEPPIFSGEITDPHESHLCEGCKAGHCSVLVRVVKGSHMGGMETGYW